jgi:hypothetical protein
VITRLQSRRAARRDDDQGVAMVMCMIFVILGTLMVAPLLGYAASVLHSSRIQTQKTTRAEAVRGALRIAMADPKALYDTCSASGLHTEVVLANPGLDVAVHTVCTTVNSAAELDDTDLRVALTATQVGSVAPLGAIGTVSPRSGSANPLDWLNDITTDSTGAKIWLPNLPAHALNHPANGGYMMPAWAGSCRVFFPGTYNSAVTISDNIPTFFASGIYYFEGTVTFSGRANVVIGEGAAEGCTDNQDAAYNAINAPTNHNISGLGATFVFGAAGRLVVSDVGATGVGPSVQFNTRLVDPTDVGSLASRGVSIISVDGVKSGSTSVDLSLAGQLQVPRSLVATEPPSDPVGGGYLPSTLIPAAVPPYVETPIIDINFTTTSTSTLFIPGYVSVPQGRINITAATGAGVGKSVDLVGGVLAATFSQTLVQPASLHLGMINRIVQKTFKLVGTTTAGRPSVTSVAIVQINDYGEFAINSWVTESSGSSPG